MYLRLVAVVIAASAFSILFGVVNHHPSVASTLAASKPGDLDQTFGQSGKVTALFFGESAYAYAAALQSDGKIIAVGGNSTTRGFSLARFNIDGTLDNRFGEAGKVVTDFNDFAFAQAVAVQVDGKIVAAGVANNSSGTREFALARYLPDGQLDSTFGPGGRVTTKFSSGGDEVHSVVIQPDGRILAAGRANGEFGLARYNSDGTLDSSFGISGRVTLDFDGSPDTAQAVALQADGKILVAGQIIREFPFPISSRKRFGVARYNANGTLDASFGASGTVTTSFNNNEFLDAEAFAIVVQADGRFVVGGWTGAPPAGSDFALARYNIDGSLDPTFGLLGRVTTDFSNMGNERIEALALQPDGKIVAAGFTDLRLSSDLFALTRYNPNGTLDSAFGVEGKVTTQFFLGPFDSLASALVLQPDGNIVVVGQAIFTTRNHMALARYIGDAASPTPTPTPASSPTPTPSPSPPPSSLWLFLAESSLPNQAAAIDSILFLPAPFPTFHQTNLLKLAVDPNTRVMVFVQNLEFPAGQTPPSVIINLTNGVQTFEISAEDVRLVLNADFAQVTFRIPDELGFGAWAITVKAHGQVTNSAVIRIR
jgi:uncharacterized delta-60 repeat protein